MLKFIFIILVSVVIAFMARGEEISASQNDYMIHTPADLEKLEHYIKTQQDTEATVRLAEFYLFGPIELQDFKKALYLLNKASAKGHIEATEILAGMYLNGRGVDQDFSLAEKLYEIGASQNHGPCQFNLGLMYKNGGTDFPKNPQKAYYWLSRATLNKESLEDMIYDAARFRNDVAILLTAEERMLIMNEIYSEKKNHQS